MMVKRKFKQLTKLEEDTTLMLIQAMRNDLAFLRQFNLMDYSMLIAIENTKSSQKNLHIDEKIFSGVELNQGVLLSGSIA